MCTKTKEIRLLLSRQIQADIKLTKADIVFAESCHEFTASGLKKIEVLHPLCSEMREGWRRHPNQFTSPYAVTDSDECLRTWGNHNLFMFFAELFQFDLQLLLRSQPSPVGVITKWNEKMNQTLSPCLQGTFNQESTHYGHGHTEGCFYAFGHLLQLLL